MPSTDGEIIFEVKDFQTLGATKVLNVYFYLWSNTGTPNAVDVAEGFADNVIAPMLARQHSSVVHVQVEATQQGVDNNFATFDVLGGTGTRTGNALANFNALSAKLNRSTKETRNGGKRFVGAVEADITQNFYDQAYIDEWTGNVETPMLAYEPEGHLVDVELVIIRKTAPGVPEVILPYEDWTYNPVTGISFSRLAKTQDSRILKP